MKVLPNDQVVTLSLPNPGFYASVKPCGKTLWEKEKLLVTSNFSFSTVFSNLMEKLLPSSSNSKLLSANSLSFEESKICYSGKVKLVKKQSIIVRPTKFN